MLDNEQARLAREITALAHGKAIYALTPVIEALGPGKREKVYLFLASEYDGFANTVEQLLAPSVAA